MIDTTLKEKFEDFNKRFENESDYIKKQVNFQSVQNVTNQLFKMYNKKETEPLKTLMIEYFDKVEKEDFPTGSLLRNELYRKHILEVGHYLMKNKDFCSPTDIFLKITIGIILDAIIHYFTKDMLSFYVPVATILMFAIGLNYRRKSKAANMYFSKGY
jgi:hypothetical protein